MLPVGFAFEMIEPAKTLELRRTVMFSIRFNRWTIAAFAFTALAVPGSLSAQTPDHPADNSAQFPTSRDLKSLTTSGSYLAARHASVERDAASAATFYRSALRTDPKNNELLDRAFISSLADGDIDEAVKLADRILTIDKSNRVARLVVGVRDLKLKKYAAAQFNINQSIRGPITDLVATLLSGWASYGAGDTKAAVANIDKLTGPEWYPLFKDLHSGMILELAGKEKDAGTRLERAYKLDDSMLRVADAYARWLSRNKDDAAATAVYEAFDKKLARHPLVLEGLRETRAGKKLSPLVDSPQTGAAEALYGIGATLTRRGGEDLALVYLQLALYLAPNHPLALLSLADLYEFGEEAGDGDQGLRAHAGEFAAEAQCADSARDQSRCRRPQRRGDQDFESRHDRRSQGPRSHHGARQYRARPQEVRRLRPDLLAGHRCVAGG